MKNQASTIACLLLAAAIWGLAFVAQRVSAQFISPFTFNAIRFILGSISLLPVVLLFSAKRRGQPGEAVQANTFRAALPGGIVAGCVLFVASSLQQFGMTGTTAGKAGFITGLYLVLVPVLGLFAGHRIRPVTWVSVVLALTGLYFISMREGFSVSKGDLFVLCGSFFWALHILVIDKFARGANPLKLSLIQFVVAGILSNAAMLLFERVELSRVLAAAVPLLYAGVFSTGVAYTLQVIGQKRAKPAASAIVLSMESVFSCLGGILILRESMTAAQYFGCFLMVGGMLLCQTPNFVKRPQ